MRTSRRLSVVSLEDRNAPAFLTGTDTPPPNPAPGTVAVTGTPSTDIDLSVLATADKPKPSLGDVVTVKVQVVNGGGGPASNVAVGVTLPAGLTFVSAQPAQGTYDSATGSWAVGGVAPGLPATLSIKVKVTDPAGQPVTAVIGRADQNDPKGDNNSATLNLSPVLAGLTLTKQASAPTLVVGSTVVFTLAVRNTGPGAATAVAVTDALPAGLQFVKYQGPSHGWVDRATQTWTIANLPAGTTAVLRVVAIVKQVGRMEAPASLTATGFDAARSQTAATAVVNGTRVNNATTWSYSAPGHLAGPVPVPGSAKLNQPPVTPIPTPPPAPPAAPVLPPPPTLTVLGGMLFAWRKL